MTELDEEQLSLLHNFLYDVQPLEHIEKTNEAYKRERDIYTKEILEKFAARAFIRIVEKKNLPLPGLRSSCSNDVVYCPDHPFAELGCFSEENCPCYVSHKDDYISELNSIITEEMSIALKAFTKAWLDAGGNPEEENFMET